MLFKSKNSMLYTRRKRKYSIYFVETRFVNDRYRVQRFSGSNVTSNLTISIVDGGGHLRLSVIVIFLVARN